MCCLAIESKCVRMNVSVSHACTVIYEIRALIVLQVQSLNIAHYWSGAGAGVLEEFLPKTRNARIYLYLHVALYRLVVDFLLNWFLLKFYNYIFVVLFLRMFLLMLLRQLLLGWSMRSLWTGDSWSFLFEKQDWKQWGCCWSLVTLHYYFWWNKKNK